MYPNGREYKITMRDLLDTPVDAIVNPANSGLSHGGGLAARISDEAGPELDDECGRILKKAGGVIPVTYALPTKAYNLPYKGIIHAVGPIIGDGDEGNYLKYLQKLTKVNLLIIDDFGLNSLTDTDKKDLMEIIEDRYMTGSTIIASQLPTKDWHAFIGDPTIADAVCDRLFHVAHKFELKGDSMRKKLENID